MDNNYTKIVFESEDGNEEFYVLEQTMLGGINYLLVTDDVDSDEGEFLILKEAGYFLICHRGGTTGA